MGAPQTWTAQQLIEKALVCEELIHSRWERINCVTSRAILVTLEIFIEDIIAQSRHRLQLESVGILPWSPGRGWPGCEMVIFCYMFLLRALTSHLAKWKLILPRTREDISPTNLIITAFDRKSCLLFYNRSNLLLLFVLIILLLERQGAENPNKLFLFWSLHEDYRFGPKHSGAGRRNKSEKKLKIQSDCKHF